MHHSQLSFSMIMDSCWLVYISLATLICVIFVDSDGIIDEWDDSLKEELRELFGRFNEVEGGKLFTV